MFQIRVRLPAKVAQGTTYERGQALTETIVVAGFFLVPLMLLGVYVGKWAFLQDRSIEAARYAAWERVVSRAAPPAGRSWTAMKSDDELRAEVSVRYFGGRGERITAIAGNANAADLAKGSSQEPLLHKHDGQPLLVEREKNITVASHEEAFDGGWSGGAMNALGQLAGNPLQMTGPTVAAVTVLAAGLPQKLFSEVGLGTPLQFKAQAAVLTDPWSANGPGEEEQLLRNGFMRNLDLLSRGKVPFTVGATTLYYLGFPLGKLFDEAKKHIDDPDKNQLKIDTNLQFGDRLQPMPTMPNYTGP